MQCSVNLISQGWLLWKSAYVVAYNASQGLSMLVIHWITSEDRGKEEWNSKMIAVNLCISNNSSPQMTAWHHISLSRKHPACPVVVDKKKKTKSTPNIKVAASHSWSNTCNINIRFRFGLDAWKLRCKDIPYCRYQNKRVIMWR